MVTSYESCSPVTIGAVVDFSKVANPMDDIDTGASIPSGFVILGFFLEEIEKASKNGAGVNADIHITVGSYSGTLSCGLNATLEKGYQPATEDAAAAIFNGGTLKVRSASSLDAGLVRVGVVGIPLCFVPPVEYDVDNKAADDPYTAPEKKPTK